MKNPVILLILLALLWTTAFAQSNASVCPEIEIEGPPGVTAVEGKAIFKITNKTLVENSSLSFNWIAENGEIVSGNGSSEIEVFAPKTSSGLNFKVTVTVAGLNSICKNSAETTAPIETELIGCYLEEFELKDWDDVNGRLDNMLITLQNNLDQYALMKVYSTSETDSSHANRLLKKIVSHIKFRKFDLDRINFEIYKSDRNYVEWMRVPYTADLPVCLDCRIVKGSSLK